jgi:hypothetical protein
MRKLPVFLFAAVIIGIISPSCSNFVLPKQIHVKAGINPEIPVNSAKFDFSKNFQKELNTVFSGDEGIKIYDYNPDGNSDNTQKFLISFPIKEQSLDFEEYFSKDLKLDEEFQAIKQTFTLDPLAAENSAISIDMSGTMKDIINNIQFVTSSIPIPQGWGRLPEPIPLNLTGFSSLSFHDGKLKLTLSVSNPSPSGYYGTLSDLKINSISAELSNYTFSPGNSTVTVYFPLKGETLSKTLSLSFSYNANTNFTLQPTIAFSDDVKIKTAKGVSFADILNRPLGDSSAIDLTVPGEFIQATIAAGSISLDTSAMKGVSLDLSGIIIKQDLNNGAPSYSGQNLAEGLNQQAGVFNLAGKKINPKQIKTTGSYSLSVTDRNNTEITFNEQGELEIPVSFAVEKFSEVYVDGQTVLDNFNGKDQSGKKIDVSLGDLAQTVSSIDIEEVGVEIDFGESRIQDLDLHIESDEFYVNSTEPIKQGTTKRFTNKTNPTSSKKVPVPYDVAANPTAWFNITLNTLNSDSEIPVLRLENVTPSKEVVLIDCQPHIVFDWEKATINPQGGKKDNDFTHGQYSGFSFKGQDIGDLLKDTEFENIEGYFVFSGPTDLNDTNTITLELMSYQDYLYPPKGGTGKISLVSKPLPVPEADKPVTENLSDFSSLEPNANGRRSINFTNMFNEMLKPNGKPLSITYDIKFGGGLTIEKAMLEDVNVFKADLVLVVPLKLKAKSEGAKIDITDYLGGMKGTNLLSFMEGTGQDTSFTFNTLTLDINLNGAPIENGQLKITRPRDEPMVEPIDLNSDCISLPLAQYLGANQKFTIDEVMLEIGPGGSLQVTRGLSFVSLKVNAGVDAYIDL